MIKFIKKMFIPSLILLWATYYFLEVKKLPEKNAILIQPVFILLVVFYFVNLFIDYKETKAEAAMQAEQVTDSEQQMQTKTPAEKKNYRLVAVFALLLMSVVLIEPLGFLITIPLLVASILWIMDVRRWIPLIIMPLVLTAIVYFVFGVFLNVPLPPGILHL